MTRRHHFAVKDEGLRQARAQRRIATLSERETDVLMTVARGLSNAEIGRQLHMGEAAAKSHVSHILTELDLSKRVQAAILAHDAGLH